MAADILQQAREFIAKHSKDTPEAKQDALDLLSNIASLSAVLAARAFPEAIMVIGRRAALDAAATGDVHGFVEQVDRELRVLRRIPEQTRNLMIRAAQTGRPHGNASQ